MNPLHRLAAEVEAWTGITLARGGADGSLARFVERRVAELGLDSVEHYLERLVGAERELLVEAVTVGFTWFHRDPQQLDAIRALLAARPAPRELQLWVAGCSTGEDAYTLAMIAEELGRRARVLGTDLNARSVAHAIAGRYGAWSLRELPPAHRRHLRASGPVHELSPELRARVSFRVHNLLDAPPTAPGGFDLVLCRNVLIYFDRRRALALQARLGTTLAPDGCLVLGASETILEVPEGLRVATVLGRAVLLRAEGGPAPATPRAPSPPPIPLVPSPVDPFERLLAGDRLLAERPDEALSLFVAATEADPLRADGHLCVGAALHLAGDPLAASEALRTALFLDPTLWPAAWFLALDCESLGLRDEARRWYLVTATHGERPLGPLARLRLVAGLDEWRAELLAVAARRGRG